MGDWLYETARQYTADPLVQGMLAAFCTFILEDPTTVISGLLVAEGHMAFMTALVGVSAGIAIGDFGLYGIGRLLGTRVERWGLVRGPQMRRAREWFDRNLVTAVILSRFVPGSRLPTYLAAGVFRAHPIRFLATAVGASLVWTFLLLKATLEIGESVLPMLGKLRWPLAVGAIIVFLLIQRYYIKRFSRSKLGDADGPPVVSAFEFWPPAVFYIPVFFYYVYLALRHRGLMLPTYANPRIYSGGWVYESKSQILDLVPPATRDWIAPYAVLLRDDVDVAEAMKRARDAMEREGLQYPVVAKPDQGQRGAGVQKIHDDAELAAYLSRFPRDANVILQELIPYQHEVGLMWYRFPGDETGRIFSVTLKEFPHVVGDGERTLRELIVADERARIISDVYFKRWNHRLDEVVQEGERVQLVFAGNHAQGAVFTNGAHIVTDELAARMDEIAGSIPEYHFGRFDIRYESLEKLQGGEGFRIVEINGAGAEATHIWAADMTLKEAYWTLFEQFSILFRIGAENRKRGHQGLGTFQMLRDFRSYLRAARDYPVTH